MKIIRRLALAVLISLSCASAWSSDAVPSASPMTDLGLGWNLGNQLDAFKDNVASETAWGNSPVSQATMDGLREAGFTSVRIPVTWLGHIGDTPDYLLDTAWLDRVAEVVGYAEKAGLKAIVNIHHDGGHWLDIGAASRDSVQADTISRMLAAVWTQIARRFADKGDFLYFESMNEIHDGGWGWGANRTDGGKQYAIFNDWQQVFVDAVRSTGANNTTRWLGIPSYCTNIDLAEYLVLPDDPAGRIMVAVHCYEPYEYALENKYTEWGHTADESRKYSGDNEAAVRNEFAKVKKRYVDRGIPVYIGEFGNVHRSDDRAEAFRKYYLEYFCKAARDNGLSLFFWDNGATGAGRECSGLIDHSTGAYINNGKEIIDAMVKGYFTQSPDYTLQSVYSSAP